MKTLEDNYVGVWWQEKKLTYQDLLDLVYNNKNKFSIRREKDYNNFLNNKIYITDEERRGRILLDDELLEYLFEKVIADEGIDYFFENYFLDFQRESTLDFKVITQEEKQDLLDYEDSFDNLPKKGLGSLTFEDNAEFYIIDNKKLISLPLQEINSFLKTYKPDSKLYFDFYLWCMYNVDFI